MVLLLNAIVCQGPEAFETLFYQCWSWKCFKYSMKRRAAAKWRLHETDKTRDSLFAQLIKKLNHWDHRISNVGRGVSIRETLIEDCFKSWSLKLCIFRKSDAWLLKKIGTPWAVFFHLPFMIKICTSFQSLIDIWVGKFAFDSMYSWYCHLEIRMVLIRGTRNVARLETADLKRH